MLRISQPSFVRETDFPINFFRIGSFEKYRPKIKANPNLSVIGHFTGPNTGCYLVGRDESMAEITAQGWDSFRD